MDIEKNEKKWKYISKVSQMSDRYGNLLIDFMNVYNLPNLYLATYEQIKEYHDKLLYGDYDY